MNDEQYDSIIEDAFAGFRGDGPLAPSLGANAVRSTVAHRRKVRTTSGLALAALAVITPTALYAGGLLDSNAPPQVGSSQSPTVAAPTAPTGSPEPTQSVTATHTPVDGSIKAAVLSSSTLNIPAWAPGWQCPSGPIKFKDGHFVTGMDSVTMIIEQVVDVDADGDGGLDTVARIGCGDQDTSYQVVAFSKNPDGTIRTVGQVARSTADAPSICDMRVGAGGGIELRVGDLHAALHCSQGFGQYAQTQWRTFTFKDGKFAQTGGPTSFPVNPKLPDFKVTSTDLVFTQGQTGLPTGVLTVTVHNSGKVAVDSYTLVIDVPLSKGLNTPGCTRTEYPQGVTYRCPQGALKAGATQTVTLNFTSTYSTPPGTLGQVSVTPPAGMTLRPGADGPTSFAVTG